MSTLSASRQPDELVFHFDVERGSIPLTHFIEAARGAEDILSCFNEGFFDKKLKYDLHVRTPEEGSLIEVLTVIIAVPSAILTFLGTDIGKAFFKGLTTKEPTEFAETIGTAIRETVTKTKSEDTKGPEQLDIASPESNKKLEEHRQRRIAAAVMALMILGFLTSDVAHLSKVGLTPERFRLAYQGRNRFYKAALENKDVKAIGFGREADFAVQRNEFPGRIIDLPQPVTELEEAENELNFETVNVVVNSPNWEREGRNWQAATGKYKDITFSIEDESFWLRVASRDLRPTIRDNLKVQWAYPTGTGKPAHIRVLRVLSYNGRELAQPMSDQEIEAYQAKLNFVEPPEADLFDGRHGTSTDNNNDKGNP